jgi:PAS domain S-box-containing protein
MLGYNKDELIGKAGWQFTHPDDLEKTSKAFRKGIKTGIGTNELRVKHKDGYYIWLETNGKVFNDKGKQKFLVIARNITDRKLTEQRLKESEEKLRILNKELENKVTERTKRLKDSEEKYRHLYENSPYGIVLLDLKGKILDINSTIPLLFGYGKNDLIGKNYFELLGIYPEDVIPALRTMPDLMSNGVKFRSQYKPKRVKIFKKDGSISWVDAEISIIKLGEDIIIQAIVQDVTEKKISEEKLKESEKILREQNIELRKLDKIKNDFITFAAHELKTPLISISGYTDYILLKHNNVLNPEIKEDLEIVRKNVKRLETFMDQLLDVMKIDEQKMKLFKQITNINDLINDCLNELSYQINEKNHDVSVNIRENININVDTERMFQVFTNVLSNAIKFTPKNGRIEINAKYEDGCYLFIIKDNGIGLTEKDKNRLFQKFEMIKKPFGGNGTGLGLYITKGIVEFHGGEIWMESEGIDKGTSLFFTIPI